MTETFLHRVAAGDMAAMQACMEAYGGLVWSLARRFCPTTSEAEDAVQEAFISIWENAGRYDNSKGAEVTFVAMIARRRIIDRGRRRQRQERVVSEVRELEKPPEDQRPEDHVPSEAADEVGQAMEALASLSERQQRVLRLAIHQGLTHEQIAVATELPLGTVKTNARRGLMRLREMLKDAKSQTESGSAP